MQQAHGFQYSEKQNSVSEELKALRPPYFPVSHFNIIPLSTPI
jgi:hypothetical protein